MIVGVLFRWKLFELGSVFHIQKNHVSVQQVSSSETEITIELGVICKSEHRIKSKDCDC